jgi:hypothetical protein
VNATWFLLDQQTVDPISPLFQYGAIGILAACAMIAVVTLWRRESARADKIEAENAQLRKEIAFLNVEIKNYYLMMARLNPALADTVDVMRSIR